MNPGAFNSENRIEVDTGRINALAAQFKKTWSRDPTHKELQGLVEDFVVEEIYYREALAMGIDKDDPVIRRRLRQKMEFFSDNAAEMIQPQDDELAKYLKAHADKFTQDAVYSFEQIYISPDLPPVQLQEKVDKIQFKLSSNEIVSGDQTMLPLSFTDATEYDINRILGEKFTKQLSDLALNEWSQPLQSGLGIHFVKLTQRTLSILPDLADIRPLVEREWRYDTEQKIKSSVRAKLLMDYDIAVANSLYSLQTTPQEQVQ